MPGWKRGFRTVYGQRARVLAWPIAPPRLRCSTPTGFTKSEQRFHDCESTGHNYWRDHPTPERSMRDDRIVIIFRLGPPIAIDGGTTLNSWLACRKIPTF